MRLFLIKLLFKGLSKRQKNEILTLRVKELFNTISSDDVLRQDGQDWLFGDKVLNKGEIKLLIGEANILLGMKLWKVLKYDIKYHANFRMYMKSESEIDWLAGKLCLYLLDIIKTRLNSLSKESGRFNK